MKIYHMEITMQIIFSRIEMFFDNKFSEKLSYFFCPIKREFKMVLYEKLVSL